MDFLGDNLFQNPLDIINLGQEEKFKLILSQASLQQHIDRKVLAPARDLRELRVVFNDSFARVVGQIRLNDEYSRKLLGLKTLGFRLVLVVKRVEDTRIFFRVRRFSLFNPTPKRLDFLRLYSHMSNRIQNKLVSLFSRLDTPFSFSEDLKTLEADMNFFSRTMPNLVGHIRLDNCQIRKDDLVFYTSSNLILKSLLEIFQSHLVRVEKIDPEADAFSLLWQKL